MKIGLLKETKTPVDNRVALSPNQVAELNKEYSDSEIVVQSSDIRAFTDDEYREAGVKVVEDVSDCDVLFGIKEAKIETLIPNKHYVFFGHIAKMQEYNRPLLQAFINKGITFSDYEYLVDENNERVCAFGWWAGVVGVYYTLRGYSLRKVRNILPKPNIDFTLALMREIVSTAKMPKLKILITGNGRVAQGATYLLRECRALELTKEQFMSDEPVNRLSFYRATVEDLVKRKDGQSYSRSDFRMNPSEYESDFIKFAKRTDIFIPCHYWDPNAPVYLKQEDFNKYQLPIKVIGDITCDICGSVKSTIRSSTHAEPYYDFNPLTMKEELAFSSSKNITVMAVDTCPNALPRDASQYFGEMLMPHVFRPLLEDHADESSVITGSTIVNKGVLTPKFDYLKDFAKGK